MSSYYVVRTNIRCERKAARSLRLAGYRVFLPRYRKDTRHHRSKKIIMKHVALFPRYVFVRVSDGNFHSLRFCDGVEALLGTAGAPIQVTSTELHRIRQNAVERVWDQRIERPKSRQEKRAALIERFTNGTRIRAVDGPFSGFEAIVDEVTPQGNIKATVSVFGSPKPIEFRPEMVEPVEDVAA